MNWTFTFHRMIRHKRSHTQKKRFVRYVNNIWTIFSLSHYERSRSPNKQKDDIVRVYNVYKDIKILKQQNRYLWVIIVCGYFSVIRSFTWLNYPSESNSYNKTSLSVSFGCWHLSGIPLSPLHFTVYTIAWQRKFEPQWVFNTILCILSGWKVKYEPCSLRVY